ncbi:AI-2E family transporter [Prauserella muralis]|uniref:AI-2E family transporter n=1 Tax=Prauserella muralis TaxID=588067 RepID=A0A2V4B0N7_9PSEU|nr:AI-2E family transporter [Prauserella muralis]PXY26938.1 AI-2E family transporter [Prauserella muralis]TWE23450.1 putative PurR-regulated permease PerM [Prauserella muralis]
MDQASDPEPRIRLTSGTLRRAAIVSVQLLVVLVLLWALRNVVQHLSYVLIPLLVALLLTAMLEPLVGWLCRHRWPRPLAAFAALLAGLVVAGGIVTFVVIAIIQGWDELRQRVSESIGQIQQWLAGSPFHLGGNLLDRVRQWLEGNQSAVVSQAMGAFTTVGSVLVGLLLALVLLLMFLYDGPKMWHGILRLWRPGAREMVDQAGRRAFHGIVQYVWVTALVALIDAIGIGIGLAVVGVPLTVPLAALVFLGGFVPYVGAVVSGFLAVAVTLVSNGWVSALIILGVVLAVQQLEGQVLQPILQGNVSRLHPVIVLLALVVGGTEGGIAGVLFAVPVVAAFRAVVLTVAEHRAREQT